MAVEHVELNVGNKSTKVVVPNLAGAVKGNFPTTECNPRTGEWARQLHLKAGGCDKTTGDKRLVL